MRSLFFASPWGIWNTPCRAVLTGVRPLNNIAPGQENPVIRLASVEASLENF